MDKKRIAALAIVLVLTVGYYLYDHSKKTTYEELIADLIGENKQVERISVYSDIPYMTKSVHTEINSEKLIERFLTIQMKMKEISTHELPLITSTMVFETDQGTYNMGFDGNNVMIGSNRYRITDDYINAVEMILLSENLKWEVTEYTPFDWH